MDVEEIRAIFKFLVLEKHIISIFGIKEDLFLPFLLLIKSGGSWSYASEETKSIAVKDVITYYVRKQDGYTLEKIYFFIDPKVIKEEGVISRLEKCGAREERELVKRPLLYNSEGEKSNICRGESETQENNSEISKKRIQLKGTPAYNVAHELEHLEKGEIKGIPHGTLNMSKTSKKLWTKSKHCGQHVYSGPVV